MNNYRYEVGESGPNRWIVLYKNEVVVYNGIPSFTTPIESLINEAFFANIDFLPDLPINLTTEPEVGQLFVFRTRMVSQAPDQVNLGDYENGDESLNDEIVTTLDDIYDSLEYVSSYGTEISSNSNEVDYKMILDANKLGNNVSNLSSIIQSAMESTINSSIAISSNLNIPVNPDYELDNNAQNNNVNIFSGESNAGGWELRYRLNEVEEVLAPTASTATQSNIEEEDEEDEEIISDNISSGNENNPGQNTSNDYKRKIGIENIFPPTLKIGVIEYSSEDEEEIKTPIGKKPFIWFNDMQINVVQTFKMSSSNFLPTVSIIFQDTYSYFDSLRFANDDDRIKVFIDSKNQLLRPTYVEFKVLKFIKIADGLFKLDGVMNVNKMFTTRIESFRDSTSFDVLKKVAKLSGVGFNTNISNTDDAMTWLNPGDRGIEFCKDVIEKSYRSETSFMWGFVDFFYNLNFIDIETQLNWDITKQLGILGSDLNHIKDQLKLSEESDPSIMYLSNDLMADGSPFRFEEYKIFNTSTYKSIEQGYSNNVKYYDWKKKEFLIFETESITSDKEEDLILKSDDEEFVSDMVRHFWEGKLINNNAHSNYHYSKVQNNINLKTLQKIGMEVTLPTPNFNLYKFMKIYVLLVNQGNKEINPIFNKKLSGEWLITDIGFVMEDDKLKQKVKLVRRNLGFSEEEITPS
jgi:hypothetical protein